MRGERVTGSEGYEDNVEDPEEGGKDPTDARGCQRNNGSNEEEETGQEKLAGTPKRCWRLGQETRSVLEAFEMAGVRDLYDRGLRRLRLTCCLVARGRRTFGLTRYLIVRGRCVRRTVPVNSVVS